MDERILFHVADKASPYAGRRVCALVSEDGVLGSVLVADEQSIEHAEAAVRAAVREGRTLETDARDADERKIAEARERRRREGERREARRG